MEFNIEFFNSLITGQNNFCTLCFNNLDSEKYTKFTDEVIFNDKNNNTMAEILNIVIGPGISDTIFNMVCLNCSKLVVQNYLFITKCRNNLKHIYDFVMNLLKCTESAVEMEIDCYKTIFMSKKNSDFTTYFDRGKCKLTSTSAACMRFNAIHASSFMKQTNSIDDICITISPDTEENNGIQDTIAINPYENVQNIALGALHTQSKENCSNTYSRNVKNQHKPIKINITDILHSESNENILKCKICLNKYTSKVNLRKHYIRVHAPKEFKCCKCLRSFGSPGILEKHMYESHTTTICSECGKIYQNIHSLKKHELTHKGSLKCDMCERVYKSRSTFNKHIQMKICGQLQRKSQANAKFQCDICHKKFCHKRSLEGHIRFSHGNAKIYYCSWCSKKFSAISKLRAHEVKHTQAKNFPCKLCGKMLVSKVSLLYHTRTHTGEKPYKCDQCGEQFISVSRRNEHIHRYHTDATYECDICKQSCKSKANLKKHKNMHFDNIDLF